MKRKKLLSALFTALLLIILPLSASAMRFDFDSDGIRGEIPDFDAIAGTLPSGAADELVDVLSAADDDSKIEAVRDRLDPAYWARFIADELKRALFAGADTVSSVLGIIILSAVAGKMTGGGAAPSLAARIPSVFVALEVARSASSLISSVSTDIFCLSSMMTAMTPVMNALYVTSGRVTEMSVNSSALMLYVTVTENLNAYVLVPFASCSLALSTVACVFSGDGLAAFSRAASRAVTWTLTAFTAVFSFVMGAQSSLASGADTLAAKGIKFAVEGSVPFVGGAVSEAVTTVGASLSLIKKTAGGAGIVMILLVLVPTMIRVASYLISLTVCRGAAELIGDGRAANVIAGARASVSVFAALSALSGVLFIFAVTLFMNSGIA
ncbi:MAG: hypothetical protein IJS78_04810 [Clostridia bacterium]|nr:hypothetical protein [Clostridia bacterium]